MSNPDTPNEKVCEELFLVYGLRYAIDEFKIRLAMYAPSQPEEARVGYDAALFSGKCRELILQFKRAHKTKGEFCFDISHSQHMLLQQYPPNSAFYVVGSFESVYELFTEQGKTDDKSFLDRYIAVSAHALINTDRLYFQQFKFKESYFIEKGGGGTHQLKAYQWLTGSKLFEQFLKYFEAGAELYVVGSGSGKRVELRPNPTIGAQHGLNSSFTPTDPQVLYREFVLPQTNLSTVLLRYCS